MNVKIDDQKGLIYINNAEHEFLIGDDGDIVSEWVKSNNKNEENARMLVSELLYIANERQGNKQIKRAKSIRDLAKFIDKNLNLNKMAGSKTKEKSDLDIVANYLLENSDYYQEKAEEEETGIYEFYDEALEEAEELPNAEFNKILKIAKPKMLTGGFLTGVAVGVAGKWAYDKYGNKVKSKFEDGGDISGEEFNYEIGGL